MKKFSRVAARIMVGLFLALIAAGLVLFYTGHADALNHVYINTANKWALVAPLVLLLGFVLLFALCTVTKYRETDLNLLLTLDILILLIYFVALYFRIRPYIA